MYVLLGSNGNITSKAVRLLSGQGARARVVGRNAAGLASLRSAGHETLAGDISDAKFLERAFAGASAVYAMIPPDYAAADFGASQDRMGEAIVAALKASGVKKVVHLSSIGAHLPKGNGPIAGLHRQELRLNQLAGVDVLHLRPGYFYENHLHAIGAIQALGVLPDMTAPDAKLPMVATADIAAVVARELQAPMRPGRRVLHLRAARLLSMRESAAILGAAIGNPHLAYVQGDPAQVKVAMRQHGFSASTADMFEEMSAAFSTGRLDGEHLNGPAEIAPTTLETFASQVFAPAFEAAKAPA